MKRLSFRLTMEKTMKRGMLVVPMLMSIMACTDVIDNPVTPGEPQADYAFADDVDAQTTPGNDFYQYAVGGWLADNPLAPGDPSIGTMDEQEALCQEWLASVLVPGSPEPVVAHLFESEEHADDDIKADLLAIRHKMDAIDDITTGEEAVRAMARLMLQGYKPMLKMAPSGNVETMKLLLALEDMEEDYASLLPNLGYTEEEIEAMMELMDDDDDAPAAAPARFGKPRVKELTHRYLMQAEVRRQFISVAKAKASMRQAPGTPQAIDILLDELGVPADMVNLLDEETLQAIDMLNNAQDNVEQLKTMLKLSIARRDISYVGLTPEALPWVLSNLRALTYNLSRLYVEQNFDEQDKQYGQQMCEDFRTVFSQRIDALQWMSAATKQQAQEKLAAVRMYVGWPEQWDEEAMAQVPSGKTLYEELAQLEEWYATHIIHDLYGPNSESKLWQYVTNEVPFFTANAMYDPNFNAVFILASNLTYPVCDPAHLPDSYNYAVLGASTIGHELTHGFDSNGSQYDKQGNLTDWWAPADKAAFEVKKQQMADYFSQFEVLPGIYLDGENTLGENIADLGGFLIGHQLLVQRLRQAGYSSQFVAEQERQYFLSYAEGWKQNITDEELYSNVVESNDVHAPAKFRVNGIVPHCDEWYTSFDVQAGQAMYLAPADRVRIW